MRLREHESIKSKFDAFRIDPRKLSIEAGFNVRDLSTPEAIERLAILKEQIREKGGVIKPLEVRMSGDKVLIVDGHRRHRAVMDLIAEGVEIDSVPAIQEPTIVNDAERILNLVLHNSGEPLSMLEKAEVVRRLINMGWDREKIQNRLGYKTPQSIVNFELLLQAPEQVREAVRQNEIAPSTAVELVRAHGDDAASKLIDMQAAAAKRGKSRPSTRDIKQPTGNADPYQVEKRNLQRLADHEKRAAQDQQDAEDAIELLASLARRGAKPRIIAEALAGCDASEAERAVRWLSDLCADLARQRDVA